MDDGTVSVGERISEVRKARGLTQRALSGRAKLSYSLLTKIEQGDRDATPGVVAAVAKALGVDVSDLTGQPYHREGRQRDAIHEQIPALRRALTYWDIPPAIATSAESLPLLRKRTIDVAEMRRQALHKRLAETLPDLL